MLTLHIPPNEGEGLAPNSLDLQAHRWVSNPPTLAFGTLPLVGSQSLVDHCVAGATLQQPELYEATMPPLWANVREGRVVWPRVGSAGHAPSPI